MFERNAPHGAPRRALSAAERPRLWQTGHNILRPMWDLRYRRSAAVPKHPPQAPQSPARALRKLSRHYDAKNGEFKMNPRLVPTT